MPRFATADGKGTQRREAALTKAGKPVDNPANGIWVTETALTTSLNTAYFVESTAAFVIVMGVAMLLTGVGFLILTLRVLAPSAVREPRRRATQAVATSQ